MFAFPTHCNRLGRDWRPQVSLRSRLPLPCTRTWHFALFKAFPQWNEDLVHCAKHGGEYRVLAGDDRPGLRLDVAGLTPAGTRGSLLRRIIGVVENSTVTKTASVVAQWFNALTGFSKSTNAAAQVMKPKLWSLSKNIFSRFIFVTSPLIKIISGPALAAFLRPSSSILLLISTSTTRPEGATPPFASNDTRPVPQQKSSTFWPGYKSAHLMKSSARRRWKASS